MKYDQQKGWEAMRSLTVIPQRTGTRNAKRQTKDIGRQNSTSGPQPPDPSNLQRHPRPHTHHKIGGRLRHHNRRAFTPLIDAKQASQLLGVPYTWLLAQARANKIPHHKLGHYVRFDPDDLKDWLRETKNEPYVGRRER